MRASKSFYKCQMRLKTIKDIVYNLEGILRFIQICDCSMPFNMYVGSNRRVKTTDWHGNQSTVVICKWRAL